MSTRLEQFIRDNREHFDAEKPGTDVWQQIQQQLEPGKKKGKVIAMPFLRRSVAAAVIIMMGLTGWWLWNRQALKNNTVATVQPANGSTSDTRDLLKEINPAYAEEVYHFTRLIELKQNELKQIETTNPDLYKKFIVDINKLDSSYNALKKELPDNPNREQLLQAMIQNLQLQSGLLNQQLEIIREIKQSKTKDNEKNAKAI